MDNTTELKIIESAFALAEEEGWGNIGLSQIARHAEIPLSDVYGALPSKPAILDAYSRHMDLAMLEASEDVDEEDSARDRLFDVIMNRFDAMAPNKTALKIITNDLLSRPLEVIALRRNAFESLRWILEAAHLDAGGFRGAIRQRGLAVVYLDAYRTWLDDDDPGLAKTMALLDRRLRRVEDILLGLRRNFSDYTHRNETSPDNMAAE